jgi:hypothetical protein
VRVDGLEENLEVMAADTGVAQQVGGGGLAGEQQDAAFGNHGANLNRGFDAAHARHDNVGEKEAGTEVARGFNGFLAAVDSGGFEPALVEDHPQSVGDDAFVIGDKHSGPDPVVDGTRIHGTLAETTNVRLGYCSVSI